MVLKPEPAITAIESLQTAGCRRIYLTPDGVPFSESLARELSVESHLILLSGHYEGIDQRIRDEVIDMEVSIGDYVLTNGTLPAAVLIDALARFIPGVLGEVRSRRVAFRKSRRNRKVALGAADRKNPRSPSRFI